MLAGCGEGWGILRSWWLTVAPPLYGYACKAGRFRMISLARQQRGTKQPDYSQKPLQRSLRPYTTPFEEEEAGGPQ